MDYKKRMWYVFLCQQFRGNGRSIWLSRKRQMKFRKIKYIIGVRVKRSYVTESQSHNPT